MPDVRIPAQEPTLAEAFSALPLEAPDRSAWPLLAERIAAAQPVPRSETRFRRWLFAGAAAAALGAIALLPRDIATPAGPSPAEPIAANSTTPAGDVGSLMAESARLEYLLQQVSDENAGSASATALALEYEARVQELDVALSDPSLTGEQRTDLWTRRVGLLREYAAVQGTAQWLATQGQAYEGDLVAVY